MMDKRAQPVVPVSSVDLAFDLLEGLKRAWREADPKKASDISAGFARGTGGIDVEWLIEKLGPPAPPPPRSGAAEIVRNMRRQLAHWGYLLPGDFWPEPPKVRDWLGRERPLKFTSDVEVWVGRIARARSLMDLEAAAKLLEARETPNN